jgi:hypothetical protein
MSRRSECERRSNMKITVRKNVRRHVEDLGPEQQLLFVEQLDALRRLEPVSLPSAFEYVHGIGGAAEKISIAYWIRKTLITVVLLKQNRVIILAAIDPERLLRTREDNGCIVVEDEIESELIRYRVESAVFDKDVIISRWTVRIGDRILAGEVVAIFFGSSIVRPAQLLAGE